MPPPPEPDEEDEAIADEDEAVAGIGFERQPTEPCHYLLDADEQRIGDRVA